MFTLFRNFKDTKIEINTNGVTMSRWTLAAELCHSQEPGHYEVRATYSAGFGEHISGMYDDVRFVADGGMGIERMVNTHRMLAEAADELDWILTKATNMTIDGKTPEQIQEFLRTLTESDQITVS